MRGKIASMLVSFLALGAVPALAEQLKEFEPQRAQRAAEILVSAAGKIEGPQVKIAADVSKAVGLRLRDDGILAVPQKGLDEEKEDAAVNTDPGAALGYLFMSPGFSLVVQDRCVEAQKLRNVAITDNQGTERTIACFLLAVRQVDDENWRLYVYGADKKPLVDVAFAEATVERPAPVALDIESVSGIRGTLVVTVLGKYRAGFPLEATVAR